MAGEGRGCGRSPTRVHVSSRRDERADEPLHGANTCTAFEALGPSLGYPIWDTQAGPQSSGRLIAKAAGTSKMRPPCPLTHDQIEVTDPQSVWAALVRARPDVVNCAAYTGWTNAKIGRRTRCV